MLQAVLAKVLLAILALLPLLFAGFERERAPEPGSAAPAACAPVAPAVEESV